jgi:hypothetical protein
LLRNPARIRKPKREDKLSELTYQVSSPFWQFVDHWQTLITGVLALIAGIGTIWATIASAQREIAANQAQSKVAQDQLCNNVAAGAPARRA